MKRITNAVDPEKMWDLLERVPRACIAFNNGGMVEVVPVEFRFQKGRCWIGVSGEGSEPTPEPNEPVKLLIDEGMYYFDMRGIWIRGRALFSEERPVGGSPAVIWFQLVPEKFVAWDFGAMREVEDR
ncbi:MAG: hypothetical protein HW393_356 [Dehalococcoidia bacterium]|nr:hypothetical protein [Dehalococcoidia bacterium]